MLERLRRKPRDPATDDPILSFRNWNDLPAGAVVQVCHPRWRGVRTVAYGFRSPVIECADLESWGGSLTSELVGAQSSLVVIQGWPPGSSGFARMLHAAGIRVKCVLHSSPVQHGAEAGEAVVVDEILALSKEGVLSEVGMAKAGIASAFAALGHPVTHVPNRAPVVPAGASRDLGAGLHVGVFAEPFWRKNVTTQLLAVGLLADATAHVMSKPSNGYLENLKIVEHGEMQYESFVALQGSTDLNLYVTLSECHPSTPQESYLFGVPCLLSRTSAVFRSDPELWELTTVDELDNPEAIAAAARNLVHRRVEAVARAKAWISEADARGAAAWEAFTL